MKSIHTDQVFFNSVMALASEVDRVGSLRNTVVRLRLSIVPNTYMEYMHDSCFR